MTQCTGLKLATPPLASCRTPAASVTRRDSAAEIAMAVVNPRASRVKDVRDREIGRLGEGTGQSFVVIGAVAAMLMAMAGWDRFWIANVIYLCFVLSAILSSVTKVIVYRRGVPTW